MKYYTVNTLEQLNAIPLMQHIQSYKFEDWQKHKDTRDKFAEIGINVEISATVSETGYYEGCCATIDAPYPVRVVPPTRYNNDKYAFYLVPNFVTRLAYKEEPPQRVGVPTAKKVQAWVDYLQRKAVWLAEQDNAKDTLIAANLAKLNSYGIVARMSTSTNKEMVFNHEQNGLRLNGQINLETGGMYVKVEVDYKSNNLEGYCKLAGLKPIETV